MQTLLSLNGNILNREDFTISPANRAFRYGDGVFETIRVSSGCVLWAEHHFARLSHASDILQFIPDQKWSQQLLTDHVLQLCKANRHSDGDARVRLSMYRNEGGYYTPLTNKASVLIESEALDQTHFSLNTKGISVDIFSEIPKAYNTLSALKSTNAQIYVLAGIHKRNKGIGDAILLNQEGRIAEATASNLFVVQNDKLITPSLSEACVDGVMRKIIIQLARENGFAVKETSVTTDRLLLADELLLTNAIQGIRWVRSFREKRFGNRLGNKLTGLLNDYAAEYIRKKTAR